MTEKYGFRLTCDFVALLCLSFSIIYFVFGKGLSAFLESDWSRKNILIEKQRSISTSADDSKILFDNLDEELSSKSGYVKAQDEEVI